MKRPLFASPYDVLPYAVFGFFVICCWRLLALVFSHGDIRRRASFGWPEAVSDFRSYCFVAFAGFDFW